MANDNKKINDLVSENDDDTSELEVLTATVVFNPEYDYESESDAATHCFETSAGPADAEDESIAALKSDLQKREENISNLQYDIEDLRTRWTGLEKELKAREVLTDNVTRELEQSNRKLTQTIGLLKKRDSKIRALESSLEQQSQRLTEAENAIEGTRAEAVSLQAELEATRDLNQNAMNSIASLNAELADERSKRKWAEDAEQAQGTRIEQLEEERHETQSLVATLQQYIEGRKSSWERQEADLTNSKRSLKEQRKENSRLAREARLTAERLRKEQAASQELQAARDSLEAARDSLQSDLEQAGAEALGAAASLAAAEESQRAQHEQIASLSRQLEDTAPLLEQEKVERQRLDVELAEQQRRTDAAQAELAALRNAQADREALLAQQQESIDELTRDIEGAAAKLATEEKRRKDLAKQLESLQQETDQLRRDHSGLTAEAAGKDEVIAEQKQDIANLTRELQSVSAGLESERSGRQALVLQHEELQQETTRLHAELEPLRVASARLGALEKANAELSGLVSSSDDVIRELRNRITKTEGYADVLRMKLQQQQGEVEALSSGRDEAAEALAEALGRIDDLTTRLEAEERLSRELGQEHQEAERRYQEEVGRIRVELEAAKDTVAQSQTLKEQLTSELAESSALRRALEHQLAEADQVRDRDIRDLSKQVAQLRQQIDDYERKISNKDAAINALLTELAHKPESAEDNAAADDVVHRLADRKPHTSDDRAGHQEKDRVTRLLIGSIDGQELRFPLFKDKLTIGRTVHNDIQLKAQYVSRRHAVVVTEDVHSRIVDWGSKNGIYVNGKRVTEKVLKNGDRVTVGTAEFKFEERPKR